MARRERKIAPGFFLNEHLGECSPLARLLFAGLWCWADRRGRLEDRPKRLKAEILPYDDANGETLLSELATHGLVDRYEVDGLAVLQIVNFEKYQDPHPKETESVLPARSGALPGFTQDQPSADPGSAEGGPFRSRPARPSCPSQPSEPSRPASQGNDVDRCRAEVEGRLGRPIALPSKSKRPALEEAIGALGLDTVVRAAVEVDEILQQRGRGRLESLGAVPGFIEDKVRAKRATA